MNNSVAAVRLINGRIYRSATDHHPADALIRPLAGSSSDGDPIGMGEAVTMRQAVASYIHGGAYAMRHDPWRGTLAPGMAADLIAIDRDPFAQTASNVRDTQVLMTMVRGRIHHDLVAQQSTQDRAVMG